MAIFRIQNGRLILNPAMGSNRRSSVDSLEGVFLVRVDRAWAVPSEIRKNVELWIACIADASAAGFEGIEVEATRAYKVEDARQFLAGKGN